MKCNLAFAAVLFFAGLMQGCNSFNIEPTPPLGWRSPVYQLLVDEAVFPQGWIVDFLQDTSTDAETNHVGRTWGNTANGAGVEQGIWRAYTIDEAEGKYESLRNSQFQPNQSLSPGTIFVEFKPPAEISFQSQFADKFYLACGWWRVAYCEVVARYRNYVTDIRMDLQAEHEEAHSDGLTYEEIEKIVEATDAKFAEFLKVYPESASPP